MAKLRKPIAVEADITDAEAKEVVIEPSDIVGGVKLADAVNTAANSPDTPDAEDEAKDTDTSEETAVREEATDSNAGADNDTTDSDNGSVSEEEDLKRKRDKKEKKQKKAKSKKEKRERGNGGRNFCLTLICIALIAGLLSLWIIYDNNQLEKAFYQVKSSKVTDNIRIVSIADLHNKEFGEDNERLVYEISKLSPDIIALVGDMMMEQEPDNYDVVLSLCKQLEEIAPVYFSLGNHEIDAMLFRGSNVYKDAKKQGIKILNNETEIIDVEGTLIDIIGLTQNPTEFEEYGKEFFEEAMYADDNFKLLLNHYPEQFLGVLDDYEIDLALAGHAHGGQVRLPWIGGLYAADQGILPELCDGYHEIGNSKLVITRGLGKSGLVPRINNTPEIAVIDLGWY